MSDLSERTGIIDRGLALHKMIRVCQAVTFINGLSCSRTLLAAKAISALLVCTPFSNIDALGNEFGHPEWLDFPRVGNGYNFSHDITC